MFVGHGLLAFALVAVGARRLGRDPDAALRVAVLAGLFATLPDVDVVYGLSGALAAGPGSGLPVDAFWAAGNEVHRGVTHSPPVGLVAACGAWLSARRETVARGAGVALLAALVAAVLLISGPLASAVATVFAVGALALVVGAGRYDVSPAGVAAAALVGLWSHPFGDLFTGEPPAFLYPFDVALAADRVVLAADPTLHLLAAFGLELAVVWFALAAFFRLTGRRPRAHVDRRAVLGVGYAGAALALPAPTLDVSYHFVFSVLAVGAVGVAPPQRSRVRSWRAAVTALAAVSLAAAAYAAVYVAV